MNRVAIVGIGGVFPGSENLDQFWDHILHGRSLSKPAPIGRWMLDPADALDPHLGTFDRTYSSHACFVENFALDPFGLDIDRELLSKLDPMYLFALAAGKQAFQSANLDPVDRSRVGVILGNIALPTEKTTAITMEMLGHAFKERLFQRSLSKEGEETHWLNRYVMGLPAGLISQALGLGGSTFCVDAACASSLYAMKLAVDELLSGRADAMLAGGMSRPDCLYTQMGFGQLRALSASGRCSPLSAEADGLVVGEGAGIFVLKRLPDAIEQGDAIHGVIHAIGLSSDIEGNILAPSSEGQLRALRSAYAKANWPVESVELIECHATGTPIGDSVELTSMHQLWSGAAAKPGRCVLGSVKSNIGHLLTGANAASLAKVLLALKHQLLPPTANYRLPSPIMTKEPSPFRVLAEPTPWQPGKNGMPRRAAITGFGFGGINAHLLLEEWTSEAAREAVTRKSFAVGSAANVSTGTRPEPIAVIGMSAQVGPWESLAEFRTRAFGGDKQLSPTSPSNWWGVSPANPADPTNTVKGFFLNRLPVSTSRFRIPPRELEEMLPQQLLMLKSACEAMDDASMPNGPVANAGVFVGLGLDLNTCNFHLRWEMLPKAREWVDELGLELTDVEFNAWVERLRDSAGPPLTPNRVMGALAGVISSRVARVFQIGGPAFTISNEESSGLKALETAVQFLQNNQLDLAIVGAVDFAGDPRVALKAREPKHVVADGAACVILKRLSDAIRDNDNIRAVIQGIGSARGGDGTSNEPNARAIERATRAAFAAAEIRDPNTVCDLTDIQEEIGDCGAATGLLRFVRACLCLHEKILPSPALAWLHNADEGPRTASINSSSVDGNHTVVLVSEHVVHPAVGLRSKGDQSDAVARPDGPLQEGLFILEGNSHADISQSLAALEQFLTARAARSIDEIAREWSDATPRRNDATFGLAMLPRDVNEALNLCRSAKAEFSKPIFTDRIFWNPKPEFTKSEIAFVFPGSGNHYAGMGRDIAVHWPAVLRELESHSQLLRDQFLPEIFWAPKLPANLASNHWAMLLGQVTTGALVSDVLRSFGVKPNAAIGYSLGETASYVALGVWQQRDLMLQRLRSSTLFSEDLAGTRRAARAAWKLGDLEPVDWIAGVIDRPAEAVDRAMEGKNRAYRLIRNTQTECVIGGDRSQIEAVVKAAGGTFIPLEGVATVHCSIAKHVEQMYRELHLLPTTAPIGIRFYSVANAAPLELSRESAAESILAQGVHGFDFPRTIEAAYNDGVRIFLEVGPGNSTTRMISQILEGKPHVAIATITAGNSDVSSVLRVIGRLIAERIKVDTSSLYPLATPRTKMDRTISIPIRSEGFAPVEIPECASAAVEGVGIFEAVEIHEMADQMPHDLNDVMVSPEEYFATESLPPVEESMFADAIRAFTQTMQARTKAHEAFLQFSGEMEVARQKQIEHSLRVAELAAGGEANLKNLVAQFLEPMRIPTSDVEEHPCGDADDLPAVPPERTGPAPWLDREQCMELAIGSIGNVLGPMYAEIDSFPTRVRLPDEPLMLVDRMMSVEGEPLSMTSGRLITEHDVNEGDWYLDGNRIPVSIAVESGQADLFLAGYLGIDFKTRGLAVYRLLDAAVTFHRSLPQPGEVISYDIRIDHFFRQGETYLFRFNFEGTVAGEPFISMRNGCAGFFSAQELNQGKGLVQTDLETRPMPGKRTSDWRPLVEMKQESFAHANVDCLRRGDLEGCFGPVFAGLPLANPIRLPGGRMTLVDRVTRIEPDGGRFGLGLIVAEHDIVPDVWFLKCHFVDDRVMPGTLMFECCLHTLRIYLMRMGWIGEHDSFVHEPVIGIASQLKCRGQVIESTQTVTYEVHIKELGYRPDAYAVADAIMYADGKAIVKISDMSVQLTGLDRETVESLWNRRELTTTSRPTTTHVPRSPAIYDHDKILAFSVGNPSDAFGERYKVFDRERIVARLPGPPYMFLDRIVRADVEPFVMQAGGIIEAEYDVPPDEWYFDSERSDFMAYCVLLEVALQPCGWLAAYIGSALTSPIDLKFRNLGGVAVQTRHVDRNVGTLTMYSKVTKVASSGGMIIQHFDFDVRDDAGSLYAGTTYFGFFSKDSLAQQVGIRDAAPYLPGEEELQNAEQFPFPTRAPFPGDMLRMVDHVELFIPNGGPSGLGYAKGTADVDATDWFYKAHFHQDPVWPGSLGLESMQQLLKLFAYRRWEDIEGQFESPALGLKHEWIYRGQILPTDSLVTIEAWVTACDDETRTIVADGYLSVDGRYIYQMKGFSLRVVSTAAVP